MPARAARSFREDQVCPAGLQVVSAARALLLVLCDGDIVDWATRTRLARSFAEFHSVRRLAAQHHWTASTPTCSWTSNYLGRILKGEKPAIRRCSGRPASRSSST